MQKKSKIQKSKGIAILFVYLIMSVILAIGLGVSGILIQQIKMTGEIGHSVVSFYAADSGVERQLYDLYKAPVGDHQPQYSGLIDIIGDTASFNVTAKCSINNENCFDSIPQDVNCISTGYCIKSIGDYQKTKRAIEIKY